MRKIARVDIAAVLILVCLAAFFRFHRLQEVPIGLWRDEAANGLEALRVLDGLHGVFFGTREPMFIYLVAVSVALLGRNPVAIRVVAAIVGTATIPVTYLLVKELLVSTRLSARLVACLTSLWLATSYWHLNFSRLGFRGILLPLLATLSFYFLWRGWNELTGVRQHRPSKPTLTVVWFVIAGLCLGLTFYTYTPSRFLPFALLPFLGSATAPWWRRQQARTDSHTPVLPSLSPLIALAALGLSCLLVLAPLGVHFLSDPASFFARSGVSVFGADLDEPVAVVLAKNTVQQLAMFGFSADPNTRHDPAGRPAFDLVTLALFLMGVVVCIRHWRKIPYLFILLWFSVMLLPAILTFPELPHYLRAIGALPVAYIFPALAVERMWHWSTTKRTSLKLRPAFAGLLAIYFALAAFFTYRDYFSPAVEGIELVKAFDPRFVEVAAIMNEIDQPNSVWLIPLGPNGEQRMAYFVIDFLYQGEAPHHYVRVDETTAAQELKEACLGKERAIMLNTTASHLSQPWFELYADSKGLIPFLLNEHAHYSGTLHFEGLDLLVYQLPARVEFSIPEEGHPTSSWDAGQEEIDYYSFSGLANLVSERYNISIALLGRDGGTDPMPGHTIVAVQLNLQSDGSWHMKSSLPSRTARNDNRLADAEPWVASEHNA